MASRVYAKRNVWLSGGPYDGKVIRLSDGGTFVFKIGHEWHGRYSNLGVWVNV